MFLCVGVKHQFCYNDVVKYVRAVVVEFHLCGFTRTYIIIYKIVI
jgi:hypothetical protein